MRQSREVSKQNLDNLLVVGPCEARTAAVAVVFLQLLQPRVLLTNPVLVKSACVCMPGTRRTLGKALTAVRCPSLSLAVRFVSDAHLILPRSQRVKTTSSNSSSSNGSIDGKDQPDAQQGSASSSGQPGKGLACQAGMHVPRGSILCICPIESHHDPRLYPDEPWAFKPDRYQQLGTVSTVKPPAIPTYAQCALHGLRSTARP
jgi:hypothetical protein